MTMSLFGKEKNSQPAGTPSAPAVPTARIETVIGPNAHFRGDIMSEGGVRVDGIFEGNIETTGNLVIGESAKVIADVDANNVSISGAVKGDITGNRVEILETGRVWGDMTVNSLLLNEGAYLRGQTTMHADIEPPLLEAPKSQTKKTQPAQSGEIVDVEPTRSKEEKEQE
jgi:cytoskeletal protein CcmA (bactofilin family)